ncbi:MAG: Glycosyl transferase family 2 [Candidatus Levybacteria bacterium GW2011_GWA2_37_36]|nr:MAG: Glycosyl transferase family 2 [Candidatus Levybacteria bacterium GW2011_GWA1_37_16]KKQ32520.1 MAG: Glycosyl transferase family 2 [Candidatus Levybacteria bacterium GW2011_GWA2_37_36]KKQ37047.1 MAG: Glycosyl transferase family 2 [Candidatus Levybacteria bacterium GW2011_GWC2_37_7]KKQ42668.1 MAG: Glycosyl transferase family 2 [Candidatus Levybacteria bacterium GW2011_GWB1_37_8]OGH51015.1 MAG: hypothetical protein A3H17_01315 [Candidatus Levybacteria bacterium RIFCSPLOWO2_12_FULL_37_14]
MKICISAIVLAKNEEKNIADCLKNLKWCDESIVIDDNSTDETVKIAEKNNAKVYSRSLDNFSNQRNFGITKASGEWMLFVDADERVSGALAFEISNVLSSWTNEIDNEYKGFYIPRFDVIWGKELRYGDSGVKLLRLAKKNAGKWEGLVHEKWKINGKIGSLKNRIIHYPHQTISEFLSEINFYTALRAKELYSRKIKVNILSIILYPSCKFVLNYFLKKGLLDGIPGLMQALLMSFHSFLVRGKLRLMWNSK